MNTKLDIHQRLALAQQRAERHRIARDTAEQLLEQKAGELYESNQALKASRDNLQQEINQATYELQASNKRLQRALDEKSTFIGAISHEIRTPLNAVVGLSELLLETPLDELQRRYLNTIFQSSATLVKMLNDVLHISKIEAGIVDLHPRPVAVREALDSLTQMFGNEASGKRLNLRARIEENVPAWLTMDEGRYGQVVTNLVSNAMKNTDQGAVTIRARYKRIGNEHGELITTVSDTGIGIDAEQMGKIFSAYEQFGNMDQGVGLGLAISSHIADMMDGTLKCASQPGVGSTFTFSIPVEITTQPAIEPDEDDEDSDLAHLRVLIAEDNEVNQQVMRAQFTQLGVVPMIVGDGMAALDALREHSFDIVFLDIQMPVLNGEQTIREIRQSVNFRHHHCVAFTAASAEDRRDKLIECGFDDFLSKPVTLSELRQALLNGLRARTAPPKQPDEPVTGTSIQDPVGYSMAHFEAQFGEGAAAIFRQIAPVFLQHSYQELDELAAAVDAGKKARVHKLSHSLKGALASIGALELSAEFAALEAEPDGSDVSAIFAELYNKMMELKGQLEFTLADVSA